MKIMSDSRPPNMKKPNMEAETEYMTLKELITRWFIIFTYDRAKKNLTKGIISLLAAILLLPATASYSYGVEQFRNHSINSAVSQYVNF